MKNYIIIFIIIFLLLLIILIYFLIRPSAQSFKTIEKENLSFVSTDTNSQNKITIKTKKFYINKKIDKDNDRGFSNIYVERNNEITEVIQISNIVSNRENISSFIEFFDKNKKTIWIKKDISNEEVEILSNYQGVLGESGDVLYQVVSQ